MDTNALSYIVGSIGALVCGGLIWWGARDIYRSTKFLNSLRRAKSVGYDTRTKLLTIDRCDDITIEFRGSDTVWHWVPSCQRCSTELESVLSDLWERLQYESELIEHMGRS